MKKLSIKTIVAIGIGAAVFLILAKFVAIPTGIPNTTVQTSYAFLALMSVIFGPIAGGLIGLIGHALNDAFSYGTVWWSWVAGSALVGLFIGLFSKRLNVENGEFGKKQIISFNIIQAIVQLFVWFVPPVLDVLIYSEPANKVIAQALFAGVSNIITVGIIGTILLAAYAKTRTKSNSLTKE
jgi:energy-coupling factor transport system substrate-specific component